jgi:hypothetical protein
MTITIQSLQHVPSAVAAASQVRALRPQGERPRTITQFLRKRGFDPASHDRSELDVLDGSRHGLFRAGGYRGLDDAADSAWQAGFLSERCTRALWHAISDDLAGQHVYRADDIADVLAWEAYDDAARDFSELYGVSHRTARGKLEVLPNFVLVDSAPADLNPLIARLALLSVAAALHISL